MTDTAPTTRRRWFRFSLGTMLVVVTIVAIWLGWKSRPNPFPYAFPDPEKQIQDVELLIGLDPARIRLSITDPAAIQAMLSKPFDRARLDTRPAAYGTLGTLVVHYSDGSEESASLFRPWGHVKYGNEYGIADLSSLRDECQRLLLQSSDPNAAWILNEPGNLK